jgi:putative ABC transport system substrate-binding protein
MAIHIERREFVATLGGAILAAPLAARAQPPAMPVIGVLQSGSPDAYAAMVTAFRRGLNEAGYVEGHNVAIEYRWAEGQYERLPALAGDLVRRQVTVMVATTTPAVLTAKAATTTIPIVFLTAADPVAEGLVVSLNRPGGNATGVTNLGAELVQKQIEMLHQMVPKATVIGALVNPAQPALAEPTTRAVQAAARTLGLKLHVLHARTERDFDTAFATLVQLRASALVIAPDSLFMSRREQLGALTVSHAMPAIYPYREFAAAGGLMSYGSSLTDAYRLVGVCTGRILNGEKAADLPVQQPTKVELIINLRTAKALGLTFPITLLGRADEVIE